MYDDYNGIYSFSFFLYASSINVFSCIRKNSYRRYITSTLEYGNSLFNGNLMSSTSFPMMNVYTAFIWNVTKMEYNTEEETSPSNSKSFYGILSSVINFRNIIESC